MDKQKKFNKIKKKQKSQYEVKEIYSFLLTRYYKTNNNTIYII